MEAVEGRRKFVFPLLVCLLDSEGGGLIWGYGSFVGYRSMIYTPVFTDS